MLLITDRVSESGQLQNILRQIEPCTVVPLHQILEFTAGHFMIICDVSLDNVGSIDLLREALARYRVSSPIKLQLLCLTRDPSQLVLSQAQALGATAILPYQTPAAQIVSTVRRLIRVEQTKAKGSESGAQGKIKEAGLAFSQLFDAAKRRQPIPAATIERGGNAVIAAIGQSSIRVWLDVVWNFDDVTYQHCLLVAGLTAAFSQKLGYSVKTQRLVSQAALVHDLGKAHIPHEILNKPGILSSAEMAIMKTHAVIGYNLLVGQREIDPKILDVVRHHHEYLDGSGYPDGLAGDQLSDIVRLTTISDIYAALIEKRPYKTPMPPEKALSILVDMPSKLDEGLVREFHAVINDV